jgi:3-oxoacyl-[acyl-carrier protein] reductase
VRHPYGAWRGLSGGLGFYAYLRFHVDSTKFRRWNMDPAVAADCPAIVHQEDIASVGQPLPPAATTPPPVTPAAPSTALAVPTDSATVPAASKSPQIRQQR